MDHWRLQFHYGKDNDSAYLAFNELLQMLSLSQLVTNPTHRGGNILDLVITSAEERITALQVYSCDISDHALVTFSIDLNPVKQSHPPCKFRQLKRINMQSFCEDLRSALSELPTLLNSTDLNESVIALNQVVSETLELHALMKTAKRKGSTRKDWYDDEIHEERKKRRQMERKYGTTPLEAH
jgi:hypothetical protein